jgi:hypothetical protein
MDHQSSTHLSLEDLEKIEFERVKMQSKIAKNHFKQVKISIFLQEVKNK